MKLSKEYIIALQCLKGFGPIKIYSVGSYVRDNAISINSPEDLHSLLMEMHGIKRSKITSIPSKGEISFCLNKADQILDASDSLGIKASGFFDDDFPEMLRHTKNEEGKDDYPVLIYYKGDLSIASLPGFAVIGTREATVEGVKAGEFFAGEFAKKGFNIVSGLAIGCDAAGHRGALSKGGITTAFLAHGLDTVYPQENTKLAQDIVDSGGLLMSEYPIGTQFSRYSFVARDRLQAALSQATLVIQTGVHGGTMHAAMATLHSDKPLYCVYYKDERLRYNDKVRGNEYLVGLGARYIGRNDVDEVSAFLMGDQSASPSGDITQLELFTEE